MTNLGIAILTLNEFMSKYQNKTCSEILKQSDLVTISPVSFITDFLVKKKVKYLS